MKQLRNPTADRWDFMAGVIGGGVEPTDNDLSFDCRGHFLWLEGKRPGQGFRTGQHLYFRNLAAGPKSITVVRFEGNPPDDVHRFALWGQALREADTDMFRAWIKAWWNAHRELAA